MSSQNDSLIFLSVPTNVEHGTGQVALTDVPKLVDITARQQENTSHDEKAKHACVEDLRSVSLISDTTKNILSASLRTSTSDKYNIYWKQFLQFCSKIGISQSNISIHVILNFLSYLYDNNKSYSLIRTARSAISYHIAIPPYKQLSEHPLMNKFFKGLYNLRPPVRKFGFVWDVRIVFDYFLTQPENHLLDDKLLTQKLVLLLLLLGGQRVNTIFWFHVNRMIVNEIGITVSPDHVLKHSSGGRKLDVFEYRSYHVTKLCVVDCINN